MDAPSYSHPGAAAMAQRPRAPVGDPFLGTGELRTQMSYAYGGFLDGICGVSPAVRRESKESAMQPKQSADAKAARKQLIEGLNEDLSREYQAVISYVVYSQVLKGAEYMSIAAELEKHAGEELRHALLVAKQIDYLGGAPSVLPKPVRTSTSPKAMLRFDLENETETIRNYRERVRQCEALEEYAMAEVIRGILVQEQEHQIDLATALRIEVPNSSRQMGVERRPATRFDQKEEVRTPAAKAARR
jgi:bacterioferritin